MRHRRPQSHLILSSTRDADFRLTLSPTLVTFGKQNSGNCRCRSYFGHHVPSLILRKMGARERGNFNHKSKIEATNKLLYVNRSQTLPAEFSLKWKNIGI